MTKPLIPAAALAQHVAIVGKTGAGKTSTAKLAIEQVVAEGSRVCVLDPVKSDWWGVISSPDGKRPGLPFHVLGGPRAHVPLHSGAGAAIAELVARGELPLSVLDMAEFEPGGHQRFFVAFAETLLKRMRGVLYLVLEEAHEFAPKERSGFEKENLAIHYAKKLATAGRSKGIRLIVATQRTQSLHNALLGSCDTLIAHRLTAPADQEPIRKWLKGNVEKALAEQVAGELASLKTGTGWLCSGEAKVFGRIQFPRISTFDNSATPTDDAAEIQVRSSDVDVAALRSLIGTAVVEAEANDPKKLKARITELERELRGRAPAGPTEEEIEARIREAEDRLQEALEQVHQERTREAVDAAIGALRAEARPALEQLHHVLQNGWKPPESVISNDIARHHAPAAPPAVRRPSPPPVPPRAAAARRAPAAEGELGKGERVILTAIAQHAEGVTREQLTVLTGYKRSSRDTYLQKLGQRGLINTEGGLIAPTGVGVDALGDDFEPLPTGDALRAHWLAQLGGGERAILEVVCRAYPGWLGRDQIDDATGYKRSSRDTYLQKLAARRLIEVERGAVRASEALFTRGLR